LIADVIHDANLNHSDETTKIAADSDVRMIRRGQFDDNRHV
jgi:hypothetical protein